MRARSFIAQVFAGAVTLLGAPAHAIINQVDGQIVPVSDRMQTCLDKSSTQSASNPAPGEGRGVLNAVADAAIAPQTFRPALRSDGRRVAQFTVVAEGGTYQNRFGWYNVGDSPFTPGNRQEIYACREVRTTDEACDCPCSLGPRRVMPSASACMNWLNPNIVEVDFDCMQRAGRWRGGPIAFYIMVPQLITNDFGPNCPPAGASNHRVYSTDNTVNDDGDYIHFLIYTSRTFRDGFYFGWEDLFRGNDNDFEDVLVRALGLVPVCVPTPEVCDGRDNNCNGQIDENLGTSTCGVGVCMRTTQNCVAGRPVTCTPGNPSTEICNNQDDNCNGLIDEGVSRACTAACGAGTQYCMAGVWGDCVGTRSPEAELCDNLDNDCNGMIDDGLARACRTACGAGVETCTRGMWGGCTATQPMPETCNNIDDDCNARVDDNVPTRACMSACGPGTAACVGGMYVCNAPQPRPEVCDGVDNDCNGRIDDGVPEGGTCGSNTGVCRAGRFVCMSGRYQCVGATTGAMTETCNGMDDNCNGLVDENNPGGGGACMMQGTTPLCSAGTLNCRDGMLRCEGGTRASPEVCNCMDDDCDGMIDEDIPGGTGLCPGGRCIGCECRTPCQPLELAPCSPGLVCNAENFCVPPLCGNRLCASNEVCMDGRCVDPCTARMCPSGQVCRLQQGVAACVEDNCYGLGCAGSQICRNRVCVNNTCATTTCPAGQFCRPDANGRGTCVGSCATLRCPPGQSCNDGRCVRDPCQGVTCSVGAVCRVQGDRGACVADPCANMGTQPGRVCVDGRLVDDPCAGITCTGSRSVICRNGQCVDPTLTPFLRDRVIGTGGDCSARPGGAQGRAPTWIAGAVLALCVFGRRRRRAATERSGGAR